MIVANNLLFSYGKNFTIKVPEWKISAGEKAAIIGSSGCGKTTFISLLAGIHCPKNGKIKIDDYVISEKNDKARRLFRLQNMGFIFQNFELLEYLNVKENVLLPFTLQNIKISKEICERLEYLLTQVGLKNKMCSKPEKLSQGEKQRVAIARALIHKPKIVIADEPTGNLDPHNSEKIMQLLWREISNDIAFVMVTHNYELLNKFDIVWEWKNGKMKART